eukprot:scaffold35957_cov36-Tisochrysis_lutea.AAC.2
MASGGNRSALSKGAYWYVITLTTLSFLEPPIIPSSCNRSLKSLDWNSHSGTHSVPRYIRRPSSMDT